MGNNSETDEVVEKFDKKIVSFWLVIGIGAGKAIEYSVQLVARELITVWVFGMDVTMIALYATLMMAGLTGLIAWRTFEE